MKIEIPTNCPVCDSELVTVKDQLFCRNQNCSAQSFKRIEHFAKTLKIKGLGPATIEKLQLESIEQIYDLTEMDMAEKLGSTVMAEKLYNQIDYSTEKSLNEFLPAFGIPLIGKSASDKIAQSGIQTLDDITEKSCAEAGLGPKATENLLEWLEYERIYFPFDLEFSKTNKAQGSGVVCITGKLSSYPTKAAAKAVLEGLGYACKDTFTKDVTILVNESGKETAKTKSAAANGVRIVTNLKEFIGE